MTKRMKSSMIIAGISLSLVFGSVKQAHAVSGYYNHGLRVCSTLAQEYPFQDEIYIKINGVRYNLGSFYQGNCFDYPNITWNTPLPRFNFEIWEDDGDHWYDRDENITGVNGPVEWLAYSSTVNSSNFSSRGFLQPWSVYNVTIITDPIP